MHAQELVPEEFVKKLKGAANLIRCNNGKEYVVKFKGHWHGTRELATELVTSHFAMRLGLPYIPFCVIHISNAFIKKHPFLSRKGFREGSQFATQYLPNSQGLIYGHYPLEDRIINIDQLPGIVAFDYWIQNLDRTRSNILIQTLSPHETKVYMIDHGSAFPGGYHWKKETLKPIASLIKSPVHRWILSFTKPSIHVNSIVEKIQSFPEQEIRNIIHSIPNDWGVKQKDREALYHYFIQQRALLPLLMLKLFDNK